jgi:flagellar protein FlgJ
MDVTPAPATWFDFGALSQMKAQAVRSQSEAADGASKQFESMFIGLVLREMRKTVSRSEMLNSQAMDTYQDMFDQQVALNMSKAGGFGIAKFMAQQGQHPIPAPVATDAATAAKPFSMPTTEQFLQRSGGVK